MNATPPSISKKKLRILILHISEFGGHKKASQNIEETFISLEPDISILNVNGFGYIYPRAERFIDSLYAFTIRHVPGIWGKMYDRGDVAKTLRPAKRIVNHIGFRKFSELINNFKPDVILATQAFPCGLAADFKRYTNAAYKVFAIVTDYHPHRFWIDSSCDGYFVASPDAKNTLIDLGVSPENVYVFGIPISLQFLYTHKRDTIAASFGFHEHIPTLLIMGGNSGFGPIKTIVSELDALSTDFQLIVVCGRNKRLYRWFKKRTIRFKKRIFYYGYVDFVHKLMDFADIIVTKAGGITVSEALSKGLGIILTDPIPGQEERNVTYLEQKQAVMYAHSTEEVPQLVESLLRQKQRLVSLRKRAREISIKDSSLRIANFILTTYG